MAGKLNQIKINLFISLDVLVHSINIYCLRIVLISDHEEQAGQVKIQRTSKDNIRATSHQNV